MVFCLLLFIFVTYVELNKDLKLKILSPVYLKALM